MHLLLAPSLAGVILVEAREIAIVALVERHIHLDGDVGLAKFRQHQFECVLRTAQHRSEGDIERQPLRLQFAAGFICFGDPLRGEIGVLPAGEQVLQVPFALAVTHQHKETVAHFSNSIQIARGQPRF
jgi:hypothetical protein